MTPRFAVAWQGEICARLAYQISLFMLPLLAATKLHGHGTQVGLTSAMQTIPAFVFSLAAGSAVNRFAASRLMGGANLIRVAVFGALSAQLFVTGDLTFTLLVSAAFAIGAAGVFYDVTYQSMLPRLVPPSGLVSANGLVQASTSAAQMLGPAVAGLLVQATGPPVATTVVGGLFAAATVAFFLLRVPASPEPVRPISARTSIAFLVRCRPIRDLCIQSALFNLHEQAFLTAFLLFGLGTLGLTGGVIGLVVGVGSVGAIAGSLTAGSLSRRWHLGRTLCGAMGVASAAFLLVPVLAAAGAPVAALGIGFALNGAGLALYNVLTITLRQRIPPAELLGQVTAFYRLAAFGTLPLGALAGGALTDALGSGTALWVITVSLVASSVLIFVSPLRRIRSATAAAGMTPTVEAA